MKQRLNEKEERKESELLVFIKAKNVASYILLISGKSPVKYRYSFLNPLIRESLKIIELLYEANEIDVKDSRRLELIRKARAKLKSVDFLSSLAAGAGCFTSNQHEIILEKIGVCSKYLLGYYNSCRKTLNI